MDLKELTQKEDFNSTNKKVENKTEEEFENVEVVTETTKEDKSKEEDSNEEVVSFKPFIKELYENKLLDLDEEDLENIEDSLEGFGFAIEQTINKKVDEGVEERYNSLLEDLPELTQKLIEISREGGDISQLIENNVIDYNTIDIDDEDNQTLVIQDYYEKKGYDSDDIEDKIAKLEELGKKDETSRKFHKELIKFQDNENKRLIEEQESEIEYRNKELVKEQEQTLKEAKNIIAEFDEIDGIQLSKSDKQELYDYIYKPVAKDEHGNLYTKWQIDNSTEEAKLQQAFRMMKKDVIIKKATTEASTKISNEIYKELKKNSISVKGINKDKDFKEQQFKPRVQREIFS